MDRFDQQVEHVARVFYETQDMAQAWDRLPNIVQEEFRQYARQAIALLEERVTDRSLPLLDYATGTTSFLC
jgi:hypothetical protein